MAAVTTKQELETAKERGDFEIIVEGELANKLEKTKKITVIGASGLAVLAAAGALAMFTRSGRSAVLNGLTAEDDKTEPANVPMSGFEIAAIIAAATFGVGLPIALVAGIFMGYEEISYSPNQMVLRKRQSSTGAI